MPPLGPLYGQTVYVDAVMALEPEIVFNVPEDQLSQFKASGYKAVLTSVPDQPFDVVLRELSPQAASTTRTFRARLKPGDQVNVTVHAYRNDDALISGPKAGERVVTAGVQKMAPGLKVALQSAATNLETKQAAR